MRFGLILGEGEVRGDLVGSVQELERIGVELVCLEESPGGAGPIPDALLAGAALAGTTSDIRVVTIVDPSSRLHPIHMAERAAVTDLLLKGRLVLGVRDSAAPGEQAERLEVLLASHASRPFSHAGERWTIPAHIPSNVGHESRVTVTPPPAQLEVPVWLDGVGSADVAVEFGVPFISHIGDDAAGAWAAVDQRLGRGAMRLRRPVVLPLASDSPDGWSGLAQALRRAQSDWGADIALVRYGDGDLRQVARQLVERVRPLLALAELPEGVEEMWEARRGASREPGTD
jgi:alkanesulfonate monooxygenase SsuD/methylene tetrahydromethanopterin reductase-like flavin-dependent oxidoreductase (luciferase family)